MHRVVGINLNAPARGLDAVWRPSYEEHRAFALLKELDMSVVQPVFGHSVFSVNRERLLAHDVAGQFFGAVVRQARHYGLMSKEHFTVDGTLIDAWASLKSFKKKDQKKEEKKDPPDDPKNPSVDFHGEKRSNETHESTTDAESRWREKALAKSPSSLLRSTL